MAHTRDELDVLFDWNQGDTSLIEKLDKLPPLLGGEGRTLDDPVVVNSSSRALSRLLIRNYISRLMGRNGVNWKTVQKTVVTDEAHPGRHVERHMVESLYGARVAFFFDLSRCHGGDLEMFRRAYEVRMLDSVDGEYDGVQ